MMKHENYSELDARMLDLLLIIQAEHGGGNNSTFTVRVTSSTRTDTYSSIAAGIGSLKVLCMVVPISRLSICSTT